MRLTETSIGSDHVIDSVKEGIAQRGQRMGRGTPAILEEDTRR